MTLENSKPEPIIGFATVTARGESTPSGGERSIIMAKCCSSGEGVCLAINGRRGLSVTFLHSDVPA